MKISKEFGEISDFHKVEEVKDRWGWFFGLGLLLTFLGCIAMSSSMAATIVSVEMLGLILVAAGLTQIAHAFWAHRWKGTFLPMLLGILYAIIGALCLTNPTSSALSITLLVGAFCLAAGLFRMIATIILRFSQWGWVFFNGLVTFILGILIVSEWPISGLWVIGFFIGVDILLSGVSLIFLSFAARR